MHDWSLSPVSYVFLPLYPLRSNDNFANGSTKCADPEIMSPQIRAIFGIPIRPARGVSRIMIFAVARERPCFR